MNSFTLSPTDPRSPDPPTQNACVESEQGENRQSRGGGGGVVAIQKPIRRERDACNNLVLDKGQTRCCNAFLLTTRSSLDNYDGRRQVIPNNTKHANDQRRLLKLSFDGAKESKYTSEIACDFTKNVAEIKSEKQGGPWSGIKGRSGGRLVEKRGGGGEVLEREDSLFGNNNNNTRLRREDAFDSLFSSENDKSTSRGFRNSAGGDSLDSSGRSPVDSSPPSPQPQKKTISCMVADVFGIVRRIKRLGFSQEARLNN